MDARARKILWLDAGAACAAGLVVLTLHDWIAALHRFPRALVLVVGGANVVYASYSGSLAALSSAARAPRRAAVDVLVAANLAWSFVCAALLVRTWPFASGWGSAHVALEGCFVAALAALEVRYVRPFARRAGA